MQPAPVFLPGESHGQRNLEGYSQGGTRVGHDLASKLPPSPFKKLGIMSVFPENWTNIYYFLFKPVLHRKILI